MFEFDIILLIFFISAVVIIIYSILRWIVLTIVGTMRSSHRSKVNQVNNKEQNIYTADYKRNNSTKLTDKSKEEKTMAQSHTGKTCPFCQFPIKQDSETVLCSSCKIPHHRECWEENGGCTTFGCHGSDRNSVRYGHDQSSNILVVDFDDEDQSISENYHQRSVEPKNISRSFYLWSVGLGYLGGIILFAIGLGRGEHETTVWSFLGVLFIGYASIITLIFIHKIWEAIQDGYARTTPGKAVGFMFIPIFILYWQFPVYWGFAKDFNKLILRRGLSIAPISEGLFLAYPILYLCILIPFVGIVAALGAIIIHLYIINIACKKVNELYSFLGEPTLIK